MKRIVDLSLAFVIAGLFVASVACAQMADIKVGKGDLKIGAILQAGLDYSLADDTTATGAQNVNGQFTLNRARFLFWGTIVPDKVKYFVQTETRNGVGALDYKMTFVDYIPQTEITVGRFLPSFTYYMPRHTGKLDMINYPLFLIASKTPEGVKGNFWDYAMWRQTGVQITTKVENFADWAFTGGLFNGPADNIADNNDAKDVLLRADFMPKTDFGKIVIGGHAWLGNLLLADDEDCAYNRFGFFGVLMHEKATVVAELVMGSDEEAHFDAAKNEWTDRSSMGFYGHAEYKVNPEIGILGRFDFFDQNTDVDDNAWTWITFGVNYYIESYNAMMYLNFIHKEEQNDWGAKESLDNDVIQLQFQVSP